jgi:hypothetical protein
LSGSALLSARLIAAESVCHLATDRKAGAQPGAQARSAAFVLCGVA